MDKALLAALTAFALSACGGGSGSATSTPTPSSHTVGGKISNLAATGLVLANASETISVPMGATTFTFPAKLNVGSSYQVSIVSQPLGFASFCAISSASGTVADADVQSVNVACHQASAVVSTFAGQGSAGSQDGIGTTAGFWNPRAIAVDSSSNVYVADSTNNRIRKITPAGVVTTLAGSGSMGSSDGLGTSASFSYPAGVAVDASGNVYVSDYYNNKIRKISPSGQVTTLAGSGSEGKLDGPASTASFQGPSGIAVDKSGNVYVADTLNSLIRKITPTGTVSTIAGTGIPAYGDGQGTTASFFYPEGLALDSAGNIFVSDTMNDVIRKITPGNAVTTLAGKGNFNSPRGLAVDSAGNLYVADVNNQLIKKVTSAGVVSTLAGNGLPAPSSYDGVGTDASFYDPLGVAVAPDGSLFVVEYGAYKIRKITAQ